MIPSRPQSGFRGEPYHRKKDDGAIRRRRPRDLSLIRLVTAPACDRQTDGRTEGLAMAIQRCSHAC